MIEDDSDLPTGPSQFKFNKMDYQIHQIPVPTVAIYLLIYYFCNIFFVSNADKKNCYKLQLFFCMIISLGQVTAIFVQSERFHSRMRQNKTQFGLYQKVEIKKSFKLYCQILVRVTTKVAKNFIHFARHRQSLPQSRAPEKFFNRVGSCLTRKQYYSLLWTLVNYDRKKFYNTRPWCRIHYTLFSS